MHKRFLSIFLGLAIAGTASAQNESVYMLQLGSFENEQLAQEAWSDVRGKYPNILGNINAQVRSVSLPPDNLTVYRTQAGPVGSRDIADRLCAQITQSGDECYVVETAMVDAPAFNNVAQAAAPAEPEFVRAARQAIPAPELPEDPASMALEAMPNVPEEPVTPVVTAQASTPKPKQARTLFGELFGEESEALYGDDEAPAVQAVPAPASAPRVQAQVERPEIPPAPEGAEAYVMENGIPENPLAGLQLPAPPPPSAITTGNQVAAPANVAPYSIPQEPMAQPAPVQQQAPVMAANDIPFQPAQPNGVPAERVNLQEQQVGGNVAVAEAIPVPLSETQPAQRVQPVQSVQPYSAEELAQRGLPSQAMPDRTYWAQVSYFESQQAALGMWDIFRRQNPNFPAVRVRVTQPFAKTRVGDNRVSLRIGPFDGPGMVGVLCKGLPASAASCGVVADLGTSTAANQPRYRAPQNRYATRYGSSARPGGVQGYYVQLGAYPTPAQAEFEWEELQRQVPALLGSLKADVQSPPLSSGSNQSFRLRTGPYIRVSSATELCGNLKQRGIRCLVVSGN